MLVPRFRLAISRLMSAAHVAITLLLLHKAAELITVLFFHKLDRPVDGFRFAHSKTLDNLARRISTSMRRSVIPIAFDLAH